MTDGVVEEARGEIALIRLAKPEILNAWDAPMRARLVDALRRAGDDPQVRAIVLTGTGERAFCAGQDLREARSFDAERAESWIREWETLYDTIRSLPKPFVVALNGLAVGSAFQVALLADFRIGHAEVRMGQPEINAGIASITGPWIMREILGVARTTDLALSGRLMPAEECFRIGIINRLVPREQVLDEALALARELSGKAALAMRLDKQWLREMSEPGFRACIAAAIRYHRESYGSGEPGRQMEKFLDRGARA
ncbi:enoyl-CoA hydratase/isomerase family protein [Bosea sp. (in: a-proteobacteria)]|uniref:enoyl-CoA hydratase/isomerase family protein n=1 Tax=Bosea sp. (in: a-proteobacteria) TaxID=1871050 RepID=UPI0026327F90|nr:enoyl-CoA hydratase/isomerase family protein [Bosea sp. (in: a-proteobacteria)]MCO5091320.1 enoyl-CoA hydratase/isomerase family protein [Bosea sp. (in: a-proteobacteria)]